MFSINSCPALVRSCLSEARAQALVPQWVLRPFWAHERSKPGARYATRCLSESCLSESCLTEASSGITFKTPHCATNLDRPWTVNHPCTNRAQRCLTSGSRRNHHNTTPHSQSKSRSIQFYTIIAIYFSNVSLFQAKLGLDVLLSPYEVPSHMHLWILPMQAVTESISSHLSHTLQVFLTMLIHLTPYHHHVHFYRSTMTPYEILGTPLIRYDCDNVEISVGSAMRR